MSETREALTAQFEILVKRREELQEDLAWRIPDVQNEFEKLKALKEAAARGEAVDVNVQQTIVDVLDGVLKDKQAELEKVEARILELGKKLEAGQG